jgi:hypothetical protein
MNFLEAMNIVDSGFDTWKDKPHNAKWYAKIDGTPIPNDLKVNIAEAICHAVGPCDAQQPAQEPVAWREPFGFLLAQSGVNNGYYWVSPEQFQHVEQRFYHLYIPVFRDADPAGCASKAVSSTNNVGG